MKELFDKYCYEASKAVTKKYSTSFYAGVKGLDKNIRADIHNIYGFVRFADEIVDSFHEFNKAELLEEFKNETYKALKKGISLNPILNSFQHTVNKYQIDFQLIDQFLHSMEMDLNPDQAFDQNKYEEYIYGSAEAVGLMCLKVFVYGNEEKYQELKPYAMKLGSAFQKINFLRDLNADFNDLGRLYFPNLEGKELSLQDKLEIEKEIMAEFDEALVGIKMLPRSSRFGVYLSYRYYRKLLKTIQSKTAADLLKNRISVPNPIKFVVFAKSYVRNSINLL